MKMRIKCSSNIFKWLLILILKNINDFELYQRESPQREQNTDIKIRQICSIFEFVFKMLKRAFPLNLNKAILIKKK
jgi:hypothetical protein